MWVESIYLDSHMNLISTCKFQCCEILWYVLLLCGWTEQDEGDEFRYHIIQRNRWFELKPLFDIALIMKNREILMKIKDIQINSSVKCFFSKLVRFCNCPIILVIMGSLAFSSRFVRSQWGKMDGGRSSLNGHFLYYTNAQK